MVTLQKLKVYLMQIHDLMQKYNQNFFHYWGGARDDEKGFVRLLFSSNLHKESVGKQKTQAGASGG